MLDKFEATEKMLDNLYERMRRNPLKTLFVLVVIAATIFIGGFLYSAGSNLAPTASASNPTTQFTGNYAAGNSAPVNQTLISSAFEPHIEYSVMSSPEKQSDGFYHTTYELVLVDGTQVIAPQTFFINDTIFVKCLSTKHVGVRIRPSPALVNSIECLSEKSPTTDMTLFWF